MLFLLGLLTWLGAALLYLSDRQQRALAVPLPAAARLAGAVLAGGALIGWGVRLGVGVGLFTGVWLFALGAILVPLTVGHLVDRCRPVGRRGRAGD